MMKLKKNIKRIVIRLFNSILNIRIPDNANRKAVRGIDPFVDYRIQKGGRIIIGDIPFTHRKNLSLSITNGAELSIGSGTFFNNNNMVNCHKKITIGENCLFGPNVVIVDHDHKVIDGKIYKDDFISKEIFIGNNVWVGAGCIILKGSYIGDGVVIGAGSIVSGYVGDNTLFVQKREKVFRRVEELEKTDFNFKLEGKNV